MPYSYDPEAAGLIPEGLTTLTIVAIDETTSRNGDPMWVVRMEDPQRREITEWIVQTPRIIDWKFKPMWEAAGLDWPTGRAIIDEQQLVDKQVQATIAHERNPDYGTQARIQGYSKPGEGDLPGQETFDVVPGPRPAVTAGNSNSGSGDEEEIPF
jgi:hypothetical protein